MNESREVSIALYGTYRSRFAETRGKATIALLPDESVAALLGRLGLTLDPGSLLVVNGEAVEPERVLQAGDRLEVFSPMAGGAR